MRKLLNSLMSTLFRDFNPANEPPLKAQQIIGWATKDAFRIPIPVPR